MTGANRPGAAVNRALDLSVLNQDAATRAAVIQDALARVAPRGAARKAAVRIQSKASLSVRDLPGPVHRAAIPRATSPSATRASGPKPAAMIAAVPIQNTASRSVPALRGLVRRAAMPREMNPSATISNVMISRGPTQAAMIAAGQNQNTASLSAPALQGPALHGPVHRAATPRAMTPSGLMQAVVTAAVPIQNKASPSGPALHGPARRVPQNPGTLNLIPRISNLMKRTSGPLSRVRRRRVPRQRALLQQTRVQLIPAHARRRETCRRPPSSPRPLSTRAHRKTSALRGPVKSGFMATTPWRLPSPIRRARFCG